MIRTILFSGTVWLGLASAAQARSRAIYPNAPANGTVVDAYPVMANFNRAQREANGLFTKSVDMAALPTCGSRRTRRD